MQLWHAEVKFIPVSFNQSECKLWQNAEGLSWPQIFQIPSRFLTHQKDQVTLIKATYSYKNASNQNLCFLISWRFGNRWNDFCLPLAVACEFSQRWKQLSYLLNRITPSTSEHHDKLLKYFTSLVRRMDALVALSCSSRRFSASHLLWILSSHLMTCPTNCRSSVLSVSCKDQCRCNHCLARPQCQLMQQMLPQITIKIQT